MWHSVFLHGMSNWGLCLLYLPQNSVCFFILKTHIYRQVEELLRHNFLNVTFPPLSPLSLSLWKPTGYILNKLILFSIWISFSFIFSVFIFAEPRSFNLFRSILTNSLFFCVYMLCNPSIEFLPAATATYFSSLEILFYFLFTICIFFFFFFAHSTFFFHFGYNPFLFVFNIFK